MDLRQVQWRARLRLRSPLRLPKMHDRFVQSSCWHRQKQVLNSDMIRMPYLHRGNVTKIVQRFAATSPYAGYTQGNLYIVYGIGLVYHDEQSVYWAYSRLIKRLDAYGPATPHGTLVLPHWLTSAANDIVPIGIDLWDLTIRLRWVYIMFGQNCTSSDNLLVIWDYCLKGMPHVFSLCAALLFNGLLLDISQPLSPAKCPLERAAEILDQPIDSSEFCARILCHAQLFLTCRGLSVTSMLQRLQNVAWEPPLVAPGPLVACPTCPS